MGSCKWQRRTAAQAAIGAVPMSIADMEFQAAPCIQAAMEKAVAHGIYGYTDGDEAYFGAVKGWLSRRHGYEVATDWIIPENSVVPGMSVAVRAFTEPGDRVLIHTPGYGPFRAAVTQNGREPVFSHLILGEDGRYHMDYDDLRLKVADPRVKMMFLCNPHNPGGRAWTEEELRRLADICLEYNVLVVSDEIHFDLMLTGKHHVFTKAAPQMAGRSVILTAPSKTFNLAGLQLSNTIIQDPTLRRQFKERSLADGYSNISYFGYHATIAAYTEGEPWLEALLNYVRKNFETCKNFLQEHFPAVRLMPSEATYLAWTDWRHFGLTDQELEAFFREEALLPVGNGAMFGAGGEGFIRLSLALPRASLLVAQERMLAAKERLGL